MVIEFYLIIDVEIYQYLSKETEKELFFEVKEFYLKDRIKCQECLKKLATITFSEEARVNSLQLITLIEDGVY